MHFVLLYRAIQINLKKILQWLTDCKLTGVSGDISPSLESNTHHLNQTIQIEIVAIKGRYPAIVKNLPWKFYQKQI